MLLVQSTMEITIVSGITEGQVSLPSLQIWGYYTELTQTFLCSQFKIYVQDKPWLPWWATRHNEMKEKKNVRYSLISHLVRVILDIINNLYLKVIREEYVGLAEEADICPSFSFVESAFLQYICYDLAPKTSNDTQELSCLLNLSNQMTFRKSNSKIKLNVTFREHFIELHSPVLLFLHLQDSCFEGFYLNPHR